MDARNKFSKDAAKKFLVAGKVLLKTVNLWPENTNRFITLTFWTIFWILLYMETTQVVFLVTNSNNIAKLTNVISSISVMLQAMAKITVIYINLSRLKKIVDMIWNEFWPSDVMGVKLEKKIKFLTNILLYCSYTFYISGVLCSVAIFSAPYLSGLRELPYKLWYPFDWNKTPIYQILYVLHGYINFHLVLHTICGYDFLYFAICSNIIAQFHLGGEVLRQLGSDNQKRTLNKLLSLNHKRLDGIHDDAMEIMIICVRHHNRLVWICKQLNNIFSLGHFVQLATSVAALCLSLVLITMVEINASETYQIMAYCFGHLAQLFLLCSVSNELTYWSSNLANSLSLSCWYNEDLKKLKIHMVLITMRSYLGDSMTALGMVNLNYATLIAVLRFSFSLYTLLGTMVK